MINQSSGSHVGGLKLHGGVLRRRILPGPCGKRSTRHPVEGAQIAGTITTTNVNISTYLLSVDLRLLKSRITSVRDTLPIHHTNIGTRRGMSKRWYTTRSRDAQDVSLREESVEQASARDIPCQVANPPTVYPLSHVYVHATLLTQAHRNFVATSPRTPRTLLVAKKPSSLRFC